MEYGICDVIGTGTIADPHRPVVAEYGCGYLAIMNSAGTAAFVKFDSGDLAGALADNRVQTLGNKTTLQDTIGAGQATFINGRLATNWGITGSPVVAGMTFLQAIDAILASIDATAQFDALRIYGET